MNRLVERRRVAPRQVADPGHPQAVTSVLAEVARQARLRRRIVAEVALGLLLIVVTLLRPVVF